MAVAYITQLNVSAGAYKVRALSEEKFNEPTRAGKLTDTDTNFIRSKGPRLPPNVPLMKQTGQIASPIAPGPPQALAQELGIVFKRRLDLALWVVLHVRLPTMGHHPAGDEVVIISI